MDNLKIGTVALLLILNGAFGAYLSKEIRNGIFPWYASYIVSFISASVYAYQLKSKLMPLTVLSVFQTFFFHAAWYTAAFFLFENELQGHKIFGLLLAFVGMLIMSL